MEVKVGSFVELNAGESEPIEAFVEAVYPDGSIDAEIDHIGHPGDGQITHVLAGNFVLASAGLTAAAKAQTVSVAKVEQLGPHTTVTRG